MREMNISEIRDRFSEVIRVAEKGETILVIRHGKPAARIVPAEETLPKGLPSLAEFRSKIKVTGKPLSQIVIEERRNARY